MRFVLIPALFLLGACAAVEPAIEKGRGFAAGATADALQAECALSFEQRKKNLDAVNAELEIRSRIERAVAQDCNGDGQPDF